MAMGTEMQLCARALSHHRKQPSIVTCVSPHVQPNDRGILLAGQIRPSRQLCCIVGRQFLQLSSLSSAADGTTHRAGPAVASFPARSRTELRSSSHTRCEKSWIGFAAQVEFNRDAVITDNPTSSLSSRKTPATAGFEDSLRAAGGLLNGWPLTARPACDGHHRLAHCPPSGTASGVFFRLRLCDCGTADYE
ncbi:hypothetical protein K458DRAFT_388636 [Lentithecium fluviatile CBS 122367]|uniref:Uncharacterized protein n=1 Tax=Lentithecium fluviatile CBS 122367 TaxID=1168545 RepID=A0A6G1J345_9PLEO|nr:hypothetical protein K458DRAFT_388636 [Lentithecium fluviatile CBS 122367]